MPILETLSEADLQGEINVSQLRKGHDLVYSVLSPMRVGNTLTAQVRDHQLYDVEVELGPGSLAATCTCPYSWAGHCKHVAAVLLKWIEAPNVFKTNGETPPPPPPPKP